MAHSKGNYTDIKYSKLKEVEEEDSKYNVDVEASFFFSGNKSCNDCTHTTVKVKKGWSPHLIKVCILGTVLTCSAIVAFLVFALPHIQSSKNFETEVETEVEWSKDIEGMASESCIRLVDVNEDGRKDIILATANVSRIFTTEAESYSDLAKSCKKLGEDPNCPFGKIMAFRGYDGKLLWEINSHGTIFEINCDNIDINLDNKLDCVATGRYSEIIAFDPRKGTVFWQRDTSVFKDAWNVYNPLIIGDITGDSVKDIIVAHGGDPKYPPEVHVRPPGELRFLDGSNGRGIGQAFTMTDQQGDKETYMSPVLHSTSDGSMYILYGMGGETVPGSFNAISLPDLYKYCTGKPLPATVTGPGKYSGWNYVKPDEHGVMYIYKSSIQGVMVPPVLVDMNKDGVKDILMLAYDGTIKYYNGETMDVFWSISMPGYETYSSPAPGYFTNDDCLDFMVHLNKGFWPDYNYSLTVIVDGSNGDIIWSMNSTSYAMSSDLILRSTEPNRDAFVFHVQGRVPETNQLMKRKTRHVISERHSKQHKEHIEESTRNSKLTYEEYDDVNMTNYEADLHDLSDDTTNDNHDENVVFVDPNFECNDGAPDKILDLFIMDRSTSQRPLRLYTLNPEKIYYNLTEADHKDIKEFEAKYLQSGGAHVRRRRHGGKKFPEPKSGFKVLPLNGTTSLCMLQKTSQQATGSAIGDVDGDGQLDLVFIFALQSSKHDDYGSYFKSEYSIRIVKINLKDRLASGDFVNVNAKISKEIREERVSLKEVAFSESKSQPWLAYLGTKGDSVYHNEI